ncbi:hypothetical protein HME9302_00961 [Alteripontixanthobacter maritimus]|uniref:Uncharacterized protein n=1 Tax=Alteripontixanthobacter maritimus TaxID=2161824 RepID=A0A369Q9B3_9SPHN|nr:hypothetical protein [Alteripontixanthobacter maritimus]RDC59766.1 hypothetical protein HME9302_00961 [Alteripontixanthobacter maritimus]
MRLLNYFRRRNDGRAEPDFTNEAPHPEQSLAMIARQIDRNLAQRKALRDEPGKRGWLTRRGRA